jgi:prepilin-type N-terminal cleavage/methylation domain-containing protein
MDGQRAIAERTRGESGFGLIELLIAMTVLVIGIMAVVAGFSAGAISLRRASDVSTAGVVADTQMELYRGLSYSNIALNGAAITAAPAPYTTDTACGATPSDCSAANQITIATACASATPEACPYRLVTGADNDSYRVDVYIKYTCVVAATTVDLTTTPPVCKDAGAVVKSRSANLVTIVVSKATSLS